MQGKEVRVGCPCCGRRLFDMELDPYQGETVIKIKCSRCKGVAAIKLKKFVLSK